MSGLLQFQYQQDSNASGLRGMSPAAGAVRAEERDRGPQRDQTPAETAGPHIVVARREPLHTGSRVSPLLRILKLYV